MAISLAIMYVPVIGAPVSAALGAFLPIGFLILFICATGARFGIFLPVWFIGGLPILLILRPATELHIATVMPPLAIACALFARDAIDLVQKFPSLKWRVWLIRGVGVLLAIITLDGLSVPITSYISISSLHDGHERVAQWIKTNVPKDAVILNDFFAAHDIKYLSRYASNKLGYRPIQYQWEMAYRVSTNNKNNANHKKIIKKNNQKGRSTFYILLRSYNTDFALAVPFSLMRERAVFHSSNYSFAVDPLRYLAPSNLYRRFIPSEWDTSYGWVGKGTSCCRWSPRIVIYELPTGTDVDKAIFSIRPEFLDSNR